MDKEIIEGLTLLTANSEKTCTIWAANEKLGAGDGDPRGLPDDTKARLLKLGWFIQHDCAAEECDGVDCEDAESGSWTHFV
jgi:hypothetical protein